MAKQETKVVAEVEQEVKQEVVTDKAKKEKKPATQKVVASNTMRPVLVLAHNENNTKAISKKNCEDLGVGESHLDQWIKEVEELRVVVAEYVRAKHDHNVSQEQATLKRNAIFPKWSAVLEAGECSPFVKELRVTPLDVDSLVGYSEFFVPTAVGTQIGATTEKVFRKYVESLVGCKMAKNAVLSDSDRDKLREYQKASSRIKKNNELVADITSKNASLIEIKAKASAEDFKAYMTGLIKDNQEIINKAKKDIVEYEKIKSTLAPEIEKINNKLNKIS